MCKLHNFVLSASQRDPLLSEAIQLHAPRCKRDTILDAKKIDWLEWQAGYASGAYLMPVTYIKKIVQQVSEQFAIYGPIPITSEAGTATIEQIKTDFQVSSAAARVRLLQLKLISNRPMPPHTI